MVLEPIQLPQNLVQVCCRSYDQSAPILTDFESLLLQAEAVERGLIPGDAKELYENAVTSSIIYMGGAGGTIEGAAAYLAQAKPLVSWDGSPNKIALLLHRNGVL